jgi:UDP-glucose 4-epimerase
VNVLVTGGAGYIGSHAVRRLLDRGHRVVVLDDLSHGYRAAIDRRAVLCEASVGAVEIVRPLLARHRIDAVLHFAAFIEVGESVRDPLKYYRNNVAQGIALLTAMQQAGVSRLVFSSTAAVYGDPVRVPIDEEHPRAPINPYGASKSTMETILEQCAAAFELRYVALRYFNVAGAAADGSLGEAHEPETHLIPNVLAAALGRRESVTLFGTDYPTPDGTCVRDYVHVEDLVSAHLLALERTAEPGSAVYNLGSEKGFSVREVVAACARVSGREIPVTQAPRRAGDPPVLVASSDKIRRELGWRLEYPDLEGIVRSAWEWHQAHPHGFAADGRHAHERGAPAP